MQKAEFQLRIEKARSFLKSKYQRVHAGKDDGCITHSIEQASDKSFYSSGVPLKHTCSACKAPYQLIDDMMKIRAVRSSESAWLVLMEAQRKIKLAMGYLMRKERQNMKI